MMPLPVPDHTILESAPLQVAIAQVRFDTRETLTAVETGRALLEVLMPLGLTAMNQVHQQQVLFGPEGSVDQPAGTARQAVGWQFVNKENTTSLSVLTDQMTLETRDYGGWEVFVAVWKACITGLVDVSSPGLLIRLGLRYVNRIIPLRASVIADFKYAGLVDPTFLGPAADSPLSEYVTAAEGRAALSFPDGTDALVQYGVTMDGMSPALVLDIDCFRSQAEAFGLDRVVKAATEMNVKALQVFQTIVQPALRAEMESAEVTP